jgi:hypothetical protein
VANIPPPRFIRPAAPDPGVAMSNALRDAFHTRPQREPEALQSLIRALDRPRPSPSGSMRSASPGRSR